MLYKYGFYIDLKKICKFYVHADIIRNSYLLHIKITLHLNKLLKFFTLYIIEKLSNYLYLVYIPFTILLKNYVIPYELLKTQIKNVKLKKY